MDQERSPAAVIGREFGIVPTLLPTWREQSAAATTVAAIKRTESRRLRREVASLHEDQEIVKKPRRSGFGNPAKSGTISSSTLAGSSALSRNDAPRGQIL